MVEAAEELNENSPAQSEVLNKYQTAAELANRALSFALSLLQPGASILQICCRTDEELTLAASKVYTKGKIPKGIAFPCCISPNHMLGYFCPADGENDLILKAGDLVKVELGAHIDGFPALVATTAIVPGSSPDQPPSTSQTDEAKNNLIYAAQVTGEVILRLLREGKTSQEVVEAVQKTTNELHVRFIEGMISHSVSKNRLADEKIIVVRPAEGQAKLVQNCTFANYDVFVVDICLSLGQGIIKSSDQHRTTVYKRTQETYALRLKTSRAIVNEITKKHGLMAFTVRSLAGCTVDGITTGINRVRIALNEATRHGVTSSYEVLEERDRTALTARLMFTTILMPSGPLKITEPLINLTLSPTKQLQDPQLVALLATPVRPSKKDRKKAADLKEQVAK